MNTASDFSDMHDLSDEATGFTNRAPKEAAMVACIACAGRGTKTIGYVHMRSVTCFNCKGTGKVAVGREKRVAAFKKGQQTMSQNKALKAAAWFNAHKVEAAWMRDAAARGFDFAQSMIDAVNNYGSLTERQMLAVSNATAKSAERKQERAVAAEANKVDVSSAASAILASLGKASSTGLKAPKLRTEKIIFSLAKATGRNPGCIYVTAPGAFEDTYLGKIAPDGNFFASRECTDEHKAAFALVANDPLKAAVEYGRITGNCACCGRQLTDKESVARGIGPICADKYF